MAYSGTKEPRFYIDEIQYLLSLGFDFEKYYEDNNFENINEEKMFTYLDDTSLFGMHPENQKSISLVNNGVVFVLPTIFGNLEGNNIGRYNAFLNHKFEGRVNSIDSTFAWVEASDNSVYIAEDFSILNGDSQVPILNGCSISGSTPENENFNPPNKNMFKYIPVYFNPILYTEDNLKVGSISNGIYYDLRSPDLDLELTIEFDGFNRTQTLGGSTITSIRYSGSPWWYDTDANKTEPWAVGDTGVLTKRNGRRVWNLKFSYLSDTDIFASNNMSNNYYEHSSSDSTDSAYNDAGDLSDDANDFRYTLEEDNSFMAQVINRIGNGQRFIFQPDKNNNNPDQFAICMLDMDEFNVTQVAHRTYNFDLKIREVW